MGGGTAAVDLGLAAGDRLRHQRVVSNRGVAVTQGDGESIDDGKAGGRNPSRAECGTVAAWPPGRLDMASSPPADCFS